ncbi:MAG: hypothetical protein ACR2IP_01050 [Solirubrobacteraceae bacterium]
MVLLARMLARLLSLAALLVLAAAGLAAAIFCIEGRHSTLSLPSLASDLHLAPLRDSVGQWLGRLEAHGPTATVAALCGAGAILLGVVVLVGALVPRRERLVVLRDGPDGVLAARRRALGQGALTLVEQPRVIVAAKVRARPRRGKPGGTLKVRVWPVQETPGGEEAARSATAALAPLTESLMLRARVRARKPRRAAGRR